MSVQLAILGFLMEREHHGYELKKIAEERMQGFTDIKFGSIYFALSKLVDQGEVERIRAERDRGRPERTVYRITDKGRRTFKQLLTQNLRQSRRVYMDVDIGVFFGGHLDRGEFVGVLRERLENDRNALKYVRNIREDHHDKEGIPPMAEVIIDHTLHHLRAEIRWLRSLIRRAEKTDIFTPSQIERRKR